MILYGVRFKTIRPMQSFPTLLHIIGERRTDPSYHFEGRFRQNELHCLFKFCLEGRGVFRDAAGEHPILPGSGFLCEIRDPATAYYYPDDAREPWNFVYVCFSGPAASEITRELVSRYGPVYHLPIDGPTVSQLTDWEKNGLCEREITPAWGARIVLDLLTTLAESRETGLQNDPAHQIVRQAQKLIARQWNRNLNVTELADLLSVSREHLTRIFKEQTSQPPYQYLLRQKMLQAGRLLKETTLSNKEIARQLGYRNPAHFSRAFKLVMRLTPSRFRQVGFVPIQ